MSPNCVHNHPPLPPPRPCPGTGARTEDPTVHLTSNPEPTGGIDNNSHLLSFTQSLSYTTRLGAWNCVRDLIHLDTWTGSNVSLSRRSSLLRQKVECATRRHASPQQLCICQQSRRHGEVLLPVSDRCSLRQGKSRQESADPGLQLPRGRLPISAWRNSRATA